MIEFQVATPDKRVYVFIDKSFAHTNTNQNNLETVIQTKSEVNIRQHFEKIYIKTDIILLISCFIQSIRLLNKKTVIS